MELVLYYIKENANLLISFLVLVFVLGILCYFTIVKFRQDNRWEVAFYGLFFKINNIDLVKLSCVVIRTFLVIFSAIIFSKSIYIYLIMIGISAIIYIFLYMKRFIYELICAIIQIITIYFIYVLNNYMIDIESSTELIVIGIALKVFVIIFALYFFLKNIYDIAENRNNKQLMNEGKVID